MRQARPTRGDQSALSVRTVPRPTPKPEFPARTYPKLTMRESRYVSVLSDGMTKRPNWPVEELAKLGSKLAIRSFLSMNGVISSYRKPRLSVSLELTFQVSWKKNPLSQL